MNTSMGATMTDNAANFAAFEGTHACVVFVDFDGVTHPEPAHPKDYFGQLPLIEQVLREYGAVDVVISSSWRGEHALENLRDFFSSDIAMRVVGVTPSIKEPSSNWLPGAGSAHAREWEWECESWMRQNRPWGTPYVAVDDRSTWFRPGCADLLLTDARTGFTQQDQDTLRAMLRERL